MNLDFNKSKEHEFNELCKQFKIQLNQLNGLAHMYFEIFLGNSEKFKKYLELSKAYEESVIKTANLQNELNLFLFKNNKDIAIQTKI